MAPLLLVAFVVAAPQNPLQVARPSIEAGDVYVGPALVRRFAFVNAGAEPLTVTDIATSCGCITPALPQRTYRSGESGELTLEVNTLTQPAGPNRWSVQVGYRCGDQAGSAMLELTARLVREVEITPAALVFQGNGAMTALVTILDRRPQALVVNSVVASSPHLRPTLTRESVPGRFAVRVDIAADCPEGQHAETITITTSDVNHREIRLPVTIVREANRAVTASPTRLTLVAGGSALAQLRSADGRPVQVESIEVSTPALTSRWAAGPGDFATVRVALDRTKWHGEALSGEVRVRLAAPVTETIVIAVTVRARDD